MQDYVCACTAGCIDDEPVLDLNYIEESYDTPELTVALLPKTDKITLLQVKKKYLFKPIFTFNSLKYFYHNRWSLDYMLINFNQLWIWLLKDVKKFILFWIMLLGKILKIFLSRKISM